MTPTYHAPSGAPSSPLRVFLADDHAVVLAGLINLLAAAPDIQVVGYASNGKSAVEKVDCLQRPCGAGAGARTGVDIVVMDVQMSPGDGRWATAEVKRHWPQIKVISLSMYDDRIHLQSLLEAGASGYVLKRSASEKLVEALHAVHRGEIYLDPAFSPLLIESLARKSKRGDVESTALTPREEEVLRLVAQGHSNKEIGVRLLLSLKSVEAHKARSTQKLCLDGRVEIIRYALAHDWFGNLG